MFKSQKFDENDDIYNDILLPGGREGVECWRKKIYLRRTPSRYSFKKEMSMNDEAYFRWSWLEGLPTISSLSILLQIPQKSSH